MAKQKEISIEDINENIKAGEAQLAIWREQKREIAKKESQNILNNIRVQLESAAALVQELDDIGISVDWNDSSFQESLDGLGLSSNQVKPLPVNAEFLELLKGFLATKKEPQTKKQIAAGLVGSDGKARYAETTVGVLLGPISREALVEVQKDGRTNLYSLKQ